MSMSVNKVTLIGHVGKDPESKTLQSGIVASRFSVATTKTWKDKATHERMSHTEWHNIQAYNNKAVDFLRKGSKVYLEGEIRSTTVEKDGIKRTYYSIIANEIVLLDPKDEAQKSLGDNKKEEEFKDDDIPF